tara:strand:- start:657 stop:947 length:291 start_codon:yes stop_codon:yes gene_type:complete
MSIWLIVEGADEAQLEARIALLRTAYAGKRVRGRDNPDEDEKIGTMRYNNARTKAFAGTTRAALANIADLAAGRPWLTLTRNPAFMSDDEWQMPDP